MKVSIVGELVTFDDEKGGLVHMSIEELLGIIKIVSFNITPDGGFRVYNLEFVV
ncbi:hypothetical protein ES703_115620 [subsurface metagenome]